ncbi:MAG: TVP38/TMEM64 family protein [Oscillospiraceae bacterium]|nr:TVP38/TMEM64 family protein [Oscillospiraceae bacterium]
MRRKDFTLDAVLSYTPDSPLLAASVLMLLFALKSLTVVFYSGVLYTASGLLFPLPAAILVNFCGTLVMSMISYLLARSLGAGQADELREKHPKLKQFETMRARNNFAFVVVLRCINIVNYDVGSMYCGAVRMPLVPFLSGSLLGKLTDVVMLSVMGASLESRNPVPFLIALVIDLSIASVVTLWSKAHNVKEE